MAFIGVNDIIRQRGEGETTSYNKKAVQLSGVVEDVILFGKTDYDHKEWLCKLDYGIEMNWSVFLETNAEDNDCTISRGIFAQGGSM